MNFIFSVLFIFGAIFFLIQICSKNETANSHSKKTNFSEKTRKQYLETKPRCPKTQGHQKEKGLQGEKKISNLLLTLGSDYHVINNMLLDTGHTNKTTQIDHIVVSVYGIFVIETKNHSKCTIRGNIGQDHWNVYYINEKSYVLRNPFKQNLGHIIPLKKMLRLFNSHFLNVVCFAGDSVDLPPIKNQLDNNTILTNGFELTHQLKQYNTPVFTQKEVAIIINKLKQIKAHNQGRIIEHITNVKNYVEKKEENL